MSLASLAFRRDDGLIYVIGEFAQTDRGRVRGANAAARYAGNFHGVAGDERCSDRGLRGDFGRIHSAILLDESRWLPSQW